MRRLANKQLFTLANQNKNLYQKAYNSAIVFCNVSMLQKRHFAKNKFVTQKRKDDDDIVVEEAEEVKQAQTLRKEGIIEENEQAVGQVESKEFQAETRQLLDIVATALYTDKEVFVRELISNASDAIEKVRQLSMISPDQVEDKDKVNEINVSCDEDKRLLIIQDTGIGMTKEELVENIGTIARSGSKAFMKQLSAAGKNASNIIGQFGVGFYSVFMVADHVKIYTKSALTGNKGYCWESQGNGSYTISEATNVQRGCKIVIQLKENEKEFAMKDTVERIIKKYSNFVAHKITLNAARVNTIEAIWLKPKDQVTAEEHKEFFKYISHYSGDPFFTYHFSTDVPLSVHALFYVPQSHSEKMGMQKLDPGVNVYCRKVLIQAKHREILPDWLRFVKGVVDSEDLPLNISREHLQDSPLIRRLNGILTKRILKFFGDQMANDRAKYAVFFEEYNKFFKEGIGSDFLYKDDLAKLMLFETSHSATEKYSLDEYIARMPADQKDIYYLQAPNRTFAETSPYFEVFKKKGIEVLFLYSPIDEFVMTSIGSFKSKEIKAVERSDVENDKQDHKHQQGALSKEQVQELSDWFKKELPTKVENVSASTRLTDTPLIIKNPENAAMRLMRKVQGLNTDIGSQRLEVNPSHPLIVKLYHARQDNADLARLVAEQLFDNALVSAGLMEDSRPMLPRLLSLLQTATKDIVVPQETAFESKE